MAETLASGFDVPVGTAATPRSRRVDDGFAVTTARARAPAPRPSWDRSDCRIHRPSNATFTAAPDHPLGARLDDPAGTAAPDGRASSFDDALTAGLDRAGRAAGFDHVPLRRAPRPSWDRSTRGPCRLVRRCVRSWPR